MFDVLELQGMTTDQADPLEPFGASSGHICSTFSGACAVLVD